MSAPDWASRSVLILGAQGMLGQELVTVMRRRLGNPAGERIIGWDIAELDIRERDAVYEGIAQLNPSVVVNAAAYTDVDGCETDIEQAMAVNAAGPGHLAEACHGIGALLLHFGTDFIFDGRAERPYKPEDEANPLSVYGRSKWEGEQAIRAAPCRHLVVRTSWLFGPLGHNFVEAILTRAKAGGSLKVVTDQVGRPTLAADLAEAIVRLLDAGAFGAVHFANSGQCSWLEFAQEIIRQAGLDVPLSGITSEKVDRPAPRPAYSVLDTSRYVELTGQTPAPWADALKRYLAARSKRARTPDVLSPSSGDRPSLC